MEEKQNINLLKEVSCPFCNDTGFDLIGLKGHLSRGWCEVYELIALSNFPIF